MILFYSFQTPLFIYKIISLNINPVNIKPAAYNNRQPV